MILAMIFAAVGGLFASGAPHPEAAIAFVQTAPAQPASQPEASAATPPATTPAKPCPPTSPAGAASLPDCKPVHKKRGHKTSSAAPTTGPTKKVVHNGSTGDLDVDIAPGVSQQQASQQLQTTNRLLAKADENLKIVGSRQLNSDQQDTVTQIKRYMKQSRDATESGDVQRAYTLANKARMLSSDLVKH